MASSSGFYARAEDLKNEVGIPATNHTMDLSIELALLSVCRGIDDYCGRRFYSATETRYYTAAESGCLLTDDILAVTALRTDNDGDGVFETTWSTASYYLAPFNAAADARPYWEIMTAPNSSAVFPTCVKRGVQVVGTFGYAPTTATPPIIKKVALLQAAMDFRAKDAPLGVVGGRDFSQDVRPAGGLHPFARRMLDPYRKPTVV